VHSEEVNCQQHSKKEPLQGSLKTVHTTPGFPVTPYRELGLSRQQQTAVGQQLHRPLYAGCPPWSSVRDQPCIRRTGTPVVDRTLLHIAADIYRADHSLNGRALSLHAVLQACAIVRPLGLRRTVQPTINLNKYCYICDIAVVFRTILPHPIYNWWPRRRKRPMFQRDLRTTHQTLITIQYEHS